MSVKKTAGVCSMAAAAMVVSYVFLDAPIALFFKDSLLALGRRHAISTDLPDLLFPITCLATVLGWSFHLLLRPRGKHNTSARFLRLLGTSVPLAYLAKSFFKFIFGRVETRYWLDHPRARPWHWLHGVPPFSGFPSGHMTVFTAFFLALGSCYPRYRGACVAAFSVLAFLLIATDYHFLSDVIAGACLGVLVHAGVWKAQPS